MSLLSLLTASTLVMRASLLPCALYPYCARFVSGRFFMISNQNYCKQFYRMENMIVFTLLCLFCLMYVSETAIQRFGQYGEEMEDHRRLQPSVSFNRIADNRNYSCDEIIRWLGTEKHYSNDKKNVLFGLVAQSGLGCQQPYIVLKDISFGSSKNMRTFFHNPRDKAGQTEKECTADDKLAVVLLSNFSINNNFSHFLHALLRLFCALLDAHIIEWNTALEVFEVKQKYTLWLDEYFKLNPEKNQWLRSFGGEVRSLRDLGKLCISCPICVYFS